jgi:RND superfamily putative drug exporter
VWIVGTLILIVLAANVVNLDTSQTTGSQFRGEFDSATGQEILARNFSPGASAPTNLIVEDPGRVEEVTRTASRFGEIRPGERGDAGVLLSLTLTEDPYSTAALDTIPRIREAVGEGVLVGGPSAEEYDLRESAARDNRVIIPLTLLVVMAILVVLLRALVAPVLLIVSVIISFGAALGVGIFVSEVIFGFTGVGPTLPLLAFVFLVALGIDYNIFLMARVREETVTHGTREGTLRGLAVTGAVITGAGIVLAGTFGALAVLPLVVLTQIGFIVAFGVLLDTFIVRSVIIPALVIDVDRRVWWPSRLAKRYAHR